MPNLLQTDQMNRLLTLVEEAARATEQGVRFFIEPASGTLSRAKSRRHHIIFGRRGSGKSSLLQKARMDLTLARQPVAYVNVEAFKDHSYPDVLLSILISTFTNFQIWFNTAATAKANKVTFWHKWFGKKPGRPPLDKTQCGTLSSSLSQIIKALEDQLHSSDESHKKLVQKRELESTGSTQTDDSVNIGLKSEPLSIGLSSSEKQSSTQKRAMGSELAEEFKTSKVKFLHRHIMDYQSLFAEIHRVSMVDSYLLLDDLYHIRRENQARVIDYFHRIAKDHNLWLKIGTIRHRTKWYFYGDPPVGLKLGDDAEEIDLDVTLEKYSLAKQFLTKILLNYSKEAELKSLDDYVTDGAIDRLVLASGGVARDFLSIFRRAVEVARERGEGSRGAKINVEDVNMAAGEYDTSKREELNRDVFPEESFTLVDELERIREFCLVKAKSNCFLLEKDVKGLEFDLIKELVDLKFLHLVRQRVTVSDRPGKIFEAYMLDLSQYAGARKRRGLNMIEFWKKGSDQTLRKLSLIYRVSLPKTSLGPDSKAQRQDVGDGRPSV